MNVLFFSALPMVRHGGVVRWTQQMVTTLRGMGHRVHVLTWGYAAPGTVAGGARKRALRAAGEEFGQNAEQMDHNTRGTERSWGPDLHFLPVDPRVARVPLLRFWGPLVAAARAGRHLIAEQDIKVVHCVAVYEAFSAQLARGRGPAAVILSVHGDFVTEMGQRRSSRLRRRLYMPAERRAFRDCDAVTTSSRWLRERLAVQIGSTRAAVIPNGIALSSEEAGLPGRRALGLPEDRPIVLTVNNLYAPYRREGLAILAAAAPFIVERVPDVLFVVAGGVNDPGRDRASLQWAQDLTRGLPFQYTGYRPQSPADLMATADLYLHSSVLDNSPTAVLEAMALGKPVIATGVGGIPELVSDGETGLLVPPDAGALASATVRLLADPALARSLGQRARERVRAEFTWARAGERFAELYEQVVQARAAEERER